jgi:homoserine O-acetyltransferase
MLDFFDLAREYDHDASAAFSHAESDFLVVSFSTDWRFAPERSEEITNALISAGKNVSYAEIESKAGHDAFLLPNKRFEAVFSNYMQRVIHSTNTTTGGQD